MPRQAIAMKPLLLLAMAALMVLQSAPCDAVTLDGRDYDFDQVRQQRPVRRRQRGAVRGQHRERILNKTDDSKKTKTKKTSESKKKSSCKGSSKKTSKDCKTVAPSSSPSMAPTITAMPTDVPSSQPTSHPTVSMAPTSSPTAAPTSPFPSSQPSSTPTISNAPTRNPTAAPTTSFPSTSPSSSPSAAPTGGPTGRPTSAPTGLPSASPTASMVPSMDPTGSPTKQPSSSPSQPPSVSMVPTVAVFATTNQADGAQISTCITRPSGQGSIVEYTFDYNLYIPTTGGSASDAVADAERMIHGKLAREALTCDYSTDEPFHFVQMSSGTADTVDNNGCDASAPVYDGLTCQLVHAAITPEVVYDAARKQRRLNADAQVVNALIEMLKSAFGELSTDNEDTALELVGFTNLDLDGKENSDTGGVGGGDPEADLLVRGNNSSSAGNGRSITAPIIIAAAGLCFVLLIVVIVSRRKKRVEKYLRHIERLDEESSLDFSYNDKLRYDDLAFDNEDAGSKRLDEIDQVLMAQQFVFKEHHDERNCVSDTCEICQKNRSAPVFIPTTNMAEERENICAELGHDNYMSPRKQPLSVDDTQIL